MIKVNNRSEYLPTCKHYGDYLSEVVLMFGITMEDAREKYGQYTYEQWDDLFSDNNPNILKFYKKGWAYRKSAGGWSVDVKIGTSWIFMAKCETKKEAIAYIEEHLNNPKSKFA